MPFFATNVSDFWKRWHDFTHQLDDGVRLYTLVVPLRNTGRWGTVISISIIFLIVGVWHGANWAYVLFGALQSLFFLPLAFANALNRPTAFSTDRLLPTGPQTMRMVGMFTLMMFSFILLRTEDIPIPPALCEACSPTPYSNGRGRFR
ncbi:MAG: hypothetical protein IPO87_14810 [Flavobacteriales bacterium]|nr:hypothetical protein [Flavobacteriales bacterium]